MKKTVIIAYLSILIGLAALPLNGSADDHNHTEHGSAEQDTLNSDLPDPNAPLNRETREKIADLLGWSNDPQFPNVCGGYYQEPLMNQLPQEFSSNNLSRISANEAIIKQSERSTLKGNILLEQPNKLSTADLAYIFHDEDTGDINEVDLLGNVYIREPGRTIIGKQANMNIVGQTGYVNDALYRMALMDAKGKHIDDSQIWWGDIAWGQANQIRQTKPDYYELDQASFTTCSPTRDAWTLKAKKIILDQEKNTGHAYNATLRVKGIPILYTPYMNFPLSDERKSGFLTPSFGFAEQNGFEVSLPYYLNLAPNYDLILSPTFYSKRGIMYGGEGRYLTQSSEGEIIINYLPNDRAFTAFLDDNEGVFTENYPRPDNNNRQSITILHHTQLTDRWAVNIDYNEVSDDFYMQDFGKNLSDVTLNRLLQQGNIVYNDQNWQFIGLLQEYQSLSPFNEISGGRDRAVYSILPRLSLNGDYPDLWAGMNPGLKSEYTNFVWPGTRQRVAGERLNLNPQINWPIASLGGYISPTVQLMQTNYSLYNRPPPRAGEEPSPDTISRTLPIIEVDNGLFFERYTSFGQTDYIQTLEPRLYYLQIPFVDQDDIPNFDTGDYRFTYNQLFRYNRFSGLDRINDANQVSLGLSTRFLDAETGIEKFSASIGQIYYFQDRRVLLNEGIAGFEDTDEGILNFLSPTSKVSPIAGLLRYNFNENWGATGDLAWDPTVQPRKEGADDEGFENITGFNKTLQQVNNANLNVYYHPAPNKVINVGYTFYAGKEIARASSETIEGQEKDNNLNQIYASYAWPLTERISTIGLLTHNISKGFSMEYFFGLEYNTCCWAARVIAGRNFLRLDQNRDRTFRNAVYFEFLLKGLGTIAANNSQEVISGVRGYQNIFR
ncbi:MAG: LPS-assembly protein LptD [Gammaproteobacteria bacterium]